MKIQLDKKLHFICLLVVDLILLMALYKLKVVGYFLIANAVSFGLGILKEVYDCFKPNPTGFSIGDLIADLAGMVLANIVFICTTIIIGG